MPINLRTLLNGTVMSCSPNASIQAQAWASLLSTRRAVHVQDHSSNRFHGTLLVEGRTGSGAADGLLECEKERCKRRTIGETAVGGRRLSEPKRKRRTVRRLRFRLGQAVQSGRVGVEPTGRKGLATDGTCGGSGFRP